MSTTTTNPFILYNDQFILYNDIHLTDTIEQAKVKFENKIPLSIKIELMYNHLCMYNTFIADENTLYFFNIKYNKLTKKLFHKQIGIIWRKCQVGPFDTKISDNLYKQLLSDYHTKGIDNYPNYIPLKDKIWDGNKSIPYNKDIYITKTYTVDCKIDKPPLLFLKTIKEMLPNKLDRMRVLSWLAYCLTGKRDIQLAQFWVGNGGNGKSELSHLFYRIMGEWATNVSLNIIMKYNFSLIELKNSRFNNGSEVDSDNLTTQGKNMIKILTGEKTLHGNVKYGNDEVWSNFTKNIFVSNNLPKSVTVRLDDAFLERVQIIEFLVKFRGTIREDPQLFDNIYEQEGGAIVYYLLKNFLPLVKKYLVVNIAEAHVKWLRYSDNVYKFLHEKVVKVEDQNKHIIKDMLWDYYNTWCNNNRYNPETRNTFFKLLRKNGMYENRRRINDVDLRIYEGYKLKLT